MEKMPLEPLFYPLSKQQKDGYGLSRPLTDSIDQKFHEGRKMVTHNVSSAI